MTDYVMIKVCLACKQELPINLFSIFIAKGQPKHNAKCKPCMQVYRKAYYEANKEQCIAQMYEWRKNNPDYAASWGKKNPDKVRKYRETAKPRSRERSLERYRKNPEVGRLKSSQFRAENPELIKTKKREWVDKNKEHIREYSSRKTVELSDWYVRSKLAANHKRNRTLRAKDIPQELIELKRLQILIQRELKNETHQ